MVLAGEHSTPPQRTSGPFLPEHYQYILNSSCYPDVAYISPISTLDSLDFA